MNNLIKANNSDIKVTYTQRDSYYYDVTISGNIKGKTFGYFINGANNSTGGATSSWNNGVGNLVGCELAKKASYQYKNGGGFSWYGGGRLNAPLAMQA